MTDARVPRPRGDTGPAPREPSAPRPGFRRALGLTALGTVLPGAGLTQTRSRRIGWTILGVTLAAVAGGAYAVLTRGVTSAALTVVARPDLLRGAAVVIAVWGLVWCA